ncbi:hypothetical protein Tco_0127188 [Tanacetum coccineum]
MTSDVNDGDNGGAWAVGGVSMVVVITVVSGDVNVVEIVVDATALKIAALALSAVKEAGDVTAISGRRKVEEEITAQRALVKLLSGAYGLLPRTIVIYKETKLIRLLMKALSRRLLAKSLCHPQMLNNCPETLRVWGLQVP